MKLAFLSPRFPEGATVGGAETLLRAFAVRLARLGHTVDFLTTCASNHFTWANELPAGVTRVEGVNVRRFPVNADRDIPNFLRVQDRICRRLPVSAEEEETWLRNNVNSRELQAFLQANGGGYDRIITGPYLFGLVYYGALAHPDRTLLLPCLHDEPFAYLDSFRRLFRSVRGWIFNAAPERDLAQALYGLRAADAPVIGIGLDPFDTDAVAARAKFGLGTPYLMYSGRREPMKGTDLLLAFMAAFRERTGREIDLVLTGSGTFETPPALRGHVHDLGFVSEQDKRNLMAGALAFCHPSTFESLGIVLLEAWLAGTPGLVHAGSAVLQWQCTESNAGLWFGTYPDFEEALAYLLDNPDGRSAMGAAGRAYVRGRYAWDVVERKLLAALAA